MSRTGRCATAGLCEAFGWCAAAGGAVTCGVAGVVTAGACVAALETLDAGVLDDETDGDPLCGASVAAGEPDEDSLGWLDAEVDAGCGAGERLAELGCVCGAASGEALADELAAAGSGAGGASGFAPLPDALAAIGASSATASTATIVTLSRRSVRKCDELRAGQRAKARGVATSPIVSRYMACRGIPRSPVCPCPAGTIRHRSRKINVG